MPDNVIQAKAIMASGLTAEPGAREALLLLKLGIGIIFLYYALLSGSFVCGFPSPHTATGFFI
jgi:hypothetical protein